MKLSVSVRTAARWLRELILFQFLVLISSRGFLQTLASVVRRWDCGKRLGVGRGINDSLLLDTVNRLGYAMLLANARAQTDVMFAALILLVAMSVALRALVDLATARLTPWAAESQ